MKIQRQVSVSEEDKVQFLRDNSHYPEKTGSLKVKETHMSWVFITDRAVYKMKKAVRYPYIDLSTLERRRHNCEAEVTLNGRLAPSIYEGIVPLVSGDHEGLNIGGEGEVVEWLVKMERLPDELMLDQKILSGNVKEEEIENLAEVMMAFYGRAASYPMDKDKYVQRLQQFLIENLEALKEPLFELEGTLTEKLLQDQLSFLTEHRQALEKRAARVAEVHGDLKPEHVCLLPAPVVIDCLEFNKDLRLLDPVEELSFFSLECEMLGNASAGDRVIQIYRGEMKDLFDHAIVDFYKSIRAVLRALSSYRHLLEPAYRNDPRWKEKGSRYLRLARKYLQ